MSSEPRLAVAYIKRSPESAARVLSSMLPEASAAFVEVIPTADAVQVVARLQPAIAAKIMQAVEAEAGAAIIRGLDLGSASAIMRQMDRSNRNRLLSKLPNRIRAALEKSLSFAPDTVGAQMTTTIATLFARDNVASALDIIKQSDRDHIDVVFVLGNEKNLIGAVSSAIALRHSTETALSEIMDTSCPTVSAHTKLEAVADPAIWHDLAHLPVVNRQHEVIGAISRKALIRKQHAGAAGVNLSGRSMTASMLMALATTSAGLMSIAAVSFTESKSQGARDEH